LQQDLLHEFFSQPTPFFLTGGAALAGYYYGHRETEDLDFFAAPGADLDYAARQLAAAAARLNATVTSIKEAHQFRRYRVMRGEEVCLVDLVIDVPAGTALPHVMFGHVPVASRRDILANKLCALLGRAESKDLVDVRFLLRDGLSLVQALTDGETRDGGLNPATLAWLLNEIRLGPQARLPSNMDPEELETFRKDLVCKLQVLAFEGTEQKGHN